MKSIKINPMLNIKNICALSFVFLTQLGCSSYYDYQMDRGSETSSQAESSRGSHDRSVERDSVGDEVALMAQKVDAFLENRGGLFAIGSAISNPNIEKAIKKINRNKNSLKLNSLPKVYTSFLNKYGSVYGEGLIICGPTESDDDDQIEYMVLKQHSFKNNCMKHNIKNSEVTHSWLIAEIDEGDQYYINLSNNGRGCIYSMDMYGTSKLFAENFLIFLDKFFEIYKTNTLNKVYQKNILATKKTRSKR